MKNLISEVENRNIEVQGEFNWIWPKKDSFGWKVTRTDWIASHSKKYFQHLESNEVVISAGGFCGMYTRFYAKKFKTVYVFEPDPLNFLCLSANNPYDNVVKLHAGLGAKQGFCNSNVIAEDNRGMTKITETQEGIIPIFTIDSFNFPKVSLIQLDTEGYELDILNGAIKTIKRCNPVVILEDAGEKLSKFMEKMGYAAIDKSQQDTIFKHQ
jgi:FkbM family methyltransferase